MPSKRILTLLALAALVGAPIAFAAVTTTSTPDPYPCASKRPSRTLARAESGRVFAIVTGTRDDYERQKVYACNARTGRIFYLGIDIAALSDDTSPTFLRRIMAPALSETTVAWLVNVPDPATNTARNEIRQISLGSGRLIRSVAVGSAFVRPLPADNSYLAWIDQARNGSCTPTCSVHVFNRQGDRVVDSGPNIEPDSLARDPGAAVGASTTVGSVARLYWINGGTARTALYGG
jgi:hypothetical protein